MADRRPWADYSIEAQAYAVAAASEASLHMPYKVSDDERHAAELWFAAQYQSRFANAGVASNAQTPPTEAEKAWAQQYAAKLSQDKLAGIAGGAQSGAAYFRTTYADGEGVKCEAVPPEKLWIGDDDGPLKVLNHASPYVGQHDLALRVIFMVAICIAGVPSDYVGNHIWSSPAGRSVLEWLWQEGLIGYNHEPTDKGFAWFDHIRTTPLPQTAWVRGDL